MTPPRGLSAGERGEIAALLAGGDKIRAVLLYRTLTGASLNDAKDYIDGLAAESDDIGGLEAQIPSRRGAGSLPPELLHEALLSLHQTDREAGARGFVERAHRYSVEWRDEALARARALSAAAVDAAARTRRGELTSAQAIGELRATHPGFTEDTYASAYRYGMFSTR